MFKKPLGVIPTPPRKGRVNITRNSETPGNFGYPKEVEKNESSSQEIYRSQNFRYEFLKSLLKTLSVSLLSQAQVLYEGVLSRKFSVSQGTGQGRIFVTFMYKVSNNNLSVRFQTIVFQSLLTGFVSPHPRLPMTYLYLHYILHFCRRS